MVLDLAYLVVFYLWVYVRDYIREGDKHIILAMQQIILNQLLIKYEFNASDDLGQMAIWIYGFSD